MYANAIINRFAFDLGILEVCYFVRLSHVLVLVSRPIRLYEGDYSDQLALKYKPRRCKVHGISLRLPMSTHS